MKTSNIITRLVRALTCGLGSHKLVMLKAYTDGHGPAARTTSFHECKRCGQISEWLSVGNGLVHQRQRSWASAEIQQTEAKQRASAFRYQDRHFKEFPDESGIKVAWDPERTVSNIRGRTTDAMIYDDVGPFDSEQEDPMAVDPDLAQALLKVRLPRPREVDANGDSFSKEAVSQLRQGLDNLQRRFRVAEDSKRSAVSRASWLHNPLMITDDHGEVLLPGYKVIKAKPPVMSDMEMGPFLIGQLVYFTVDHTPEYEAQPTAERGRVVGAILSYDAYKQIFTIGYDGRTFTTEHTNPSGYWPDSYEKFILHDVQLEVAPPSVTMTCCANCGTTDIRQNADLRQDTFTGEWAVVQTFDNIYCKACDDEVATVEVVFDLEDDGTSPPVRYAQHGRLIEESAAAWAPPTVREEVPPPPNYGVAPITPMTPEEAAAARLDFSVDPYVGHAALVPIDGPPPGFHSTGTIPHESGPRPTFWPDSPRTTEVNITGSDWGTAAAELTPEGTRVDVEGVVWYAMSRAMADELDKEMTGEQLPEDPDKA